MIRRIAILFLLACACSRAADFVIQATITVTNFAGIATNGTDTLTINSDKRTATNIVSADAAHLFYGTNSMTKGTTNFYNHVALHPFGSGSSLLLLSWNTTNSFKLIAQRNQTIAATVGGVWGTVTLATNSITNTIPVVVPASSVAAASQTNIGSELTYYLNKASNAIAAAATALSNHVNLSTAQEIGQKTVTNSVIAKSRGTNLFGLHGSVFALTNGYYSNSVIDRPIITNGVNYGEAFASIGSAEFSEQFGSNATATAYGALAVGYTAFASGTSSVAVGSAEATGYAATALGNVASATGYISLALGSDAVASEQFAMAIGASSSANYSNSVAIGTGVATQRTNEIRLGSASGIIQDVVIGGRLDVAGQLTNNALRVTGGTLTNVAAAFSSLTATSGTFHALNATNAVIQASSVTATNSTNFGGYHTNIFSDRPFNTNLTAKGNITLAGATAHPRYDISTLANGNNIGVPFGSNNYIRLAGTLTASASIVGIVGSGTSGGTDGQWFKVENDTGYTITWAQNTADPVPANRIDTLTGADVSMADQGWAWLIYDSSESRWKLVDVWPITAQATNALATVWTNSVAVSASATNLNIIYGSNVVIRTTNNAGLVDVQISAVGQTNQNAVGSVWTNGVTVSNSATNWDIITGTNTLVLATNASGKVSVQVNATVNPQTNQTVKLNIPLQVQSAWRPSTNFASLEAGYAQWELLFPRTNSAGSAVDLQARWQFNCPTNYVTNTLQFGFWSFLSYTNGPNASNAIWKATVMRHNTAGGTATNDARVGPFDAGTSTLTTAWPADYQGTNKVIFTSVTISNCFMAPGESGLLKLERMNTTDGTLQTVNLVDLKLQCDTR